MLRLLLIKFVFISKCLTKILHVNYNVNSTKFDIITSKIDNSKEYQKEKTENEFPAGIGETVLKGLIELWNNKNSGVIDLIFADNCVCKDPFGTNVSL